MAIFRSFAFKYLSVVYRSRLYSSMTGVRGLVLGIHCDEESKTLKLSKSADKYNVQTNGQLLKLIELGGPITCGSQRTFWGLGEYDVISVAGLGNGLHDWDPLERLDGNKENVRIAASAGANALLSNKVTDIHVEDMGDARSAAEGAYLGVYKYQQFRTTEKCKPEARIEYAGDEQFKGDWLLGKSLAKNQNWARRLAETAANHMTPTKFVDDIRRNMSNKVQVEAHNRAWAEQQKMGSFLSVAAGSVEPPVFLELTYKGSDHKKPICLVGKGITFDSGGISIKPSSKMDAMRGDMSGGAIVAAVLNAFAENNVKAYVKGFIALTENLPSGSATKPGDVVIARNGKSICVDNTDAEGRLVLADALDYAAEFKPKLILDLATLTGACGVALGDCLSGAFCNDEDLWRLLETASNITGDRLWRMPLFKHYTKQVTDYEGYDLNNIGKLTGKGGACTAAAFLREFVPKGIPWTHLDIAPVMCQSTDQPYVNNGMAGRPLRTVYELVCQYSQK